MQDASGAPQDGATRFAADGTLEIFDGVGWAPYQPATDDGYGSVFKGLPSPVSEDGEPEDDGRTAGRA